MFGLTTAVGSIFYLCELIVFETVGQPSYFS